MSADVATAASEFTIRRKIFTLMGASFHIYKPDGSLMGFCRQKAFKLKEDIRVFSDESQEREWVAIKARSVIDFSAAYDVFDSRSQAKIGAFKRKGFTSMFRDSWIALDENDNEIGKIQEDGSLLAFLRRFGGLSLFFPQTFHLRDDEGAEIARFKTHFNPFVHRMTVSVFPQSHYNPLLVVAAGMLLMAIEGRQQ